MLLGVWSRFEVLTFVGVLLLVALLIWRREALTLAVTYAGAAILVTASLLLVYRLEGVDPSEAWFYTAHTFLDSTPDSWLTPACQADPTENCREADGLAYFGPADLHAGILPLVLNHPLITVAKTLRSAWDNLWVLFGPNLSTLPGLLPFVVLVLAAVPTARQLLKRTRVAVWVAALAVLAETVLPPLSWAPPHPQYHLQLVFFSVVLLVPLLMALVGLPRGRLVVLAFLIANAGLSAFRYTRYPGY
jgi:sulfite exporter TauE/SafE